MSQPAVCLIVDDDEDTCWVLAHVLRKSGVETRYVLRGVQAVEEVRAHRFAVVLLDAVLPDMKGLDLACRIRAIQPNIRIVLVSGYFYPDDSLVREAKANGVIQEFVGKPFLHCEIVHAVRMGLPEFVSSIGTGASAMEPVPYSSPGSPVTCGNERSLRHERGGAGMASRLP